MSLMFSISTFACGGLFCDAPFDGAPPVEQTGEVVVFDVADGWTTMQVRIAYEGEADDFAWVLPVPGVPEIAPGSAPLFDHLARRTAPMWSMWSTDDCEESGETDTDADSDADSDAQSDLDMDIAPGAEGVTVLDRGLVGPYDMAVLSADDAGGLESWLQGAGYNVPETLDAFAEPYITPDIRFVALKLASDRTVGEIAPLSLRFEGDSPSVPIRMTALAATDDMPIEVYLFGHGRAVPTNYLHVRLNPFSLPWAVRDSGMSVLPAAIDEAGGHAFETVYAGASPELMVLPDDAVLSEMRRTEDLVEWIRLLSSQAMTYDSFVLAEILGLPEDPPPTSFLACPTCFEDALEMAQDVFDPVEATDAFAARVVEPARRGNTILGSGRMLTRLRTVLSPHEMTLDPQFAFNPELPLEQNIKTMTLARKCRAQGIEGSRYEVTFGDEVFGLPSDAALARQGTSIQDVIDERGEMSALVVEDLGTGTTLVDHRDVVFARMRGGRALTGGCATAPVGGLGGVSLGVLFAMAWCRRRE